MGYAEKLRQSLFEPKKFADGLKNEKSIWFAVVVAILFFFIVTFIDVFFNPEFGVKFGEEPSPIFRVLIFVFTLIFSFLLIFVMVGILHLFLKMLGGKGTFVNTFNSSVLVYLPYYIAQPILAVILFLLHDAFDVITSFKEIPQNVFLVMPYIFYIIVVVGLYIYCIWWNIYSASIMHKISKLRAFVGIIVLPILLVLLLALLIFIFIVVFIAASFSAAL